MNKLKGVGEQGDQPEGEDAAEGRTTSEQRLHLVDLGRALDDEISPEARNKTAFASPWPSTCSSTAAMASGVPAAAPRR